MENTLSLNRSRVVEHEILNEIMPLKFWIANIIVNGGQGRKGGKGSKYER